MLSYSWQAADVFRPSEKQRPEDSYAGWVQTKIKTESKGFKLSKNIVKWRWKRKQTQKAGIQKLDKVDIWEVDIQKHKCYTNSKCLLWRFLPYPLMGINHYSFVEISVLPSVPLYPFCVTDVCNNEASESSWTTHILHSTFCPLNDFSVRTSCVQGNMWFTHAFSFLTFYMVLCPLDILVLIAWIP